MNGSISHHSPTTAQLAAVVCGIFAALTVHANGDESMTPPNGSPPSMVDLHNSRNALGEPEASALPTPGDLRTWGHSQHLFAAKLVKAEQGPTAESMPPIYTFTLKLNVERVMRSERQVGDTITVHFQARQIEEPVLPVGSLCVVAATEERGQLRVDRIERAEDATLVAAHRVGNVLPGWSVKDDKLFSPWASLGEKAWPGDDDAGDEVRRGTATGRPMLTVGRGIAFSVEAVPPKKEIQWTNPDGDGAYRIRLKNTTNQPVRIPALRQVGERLAWAESLIAIHDGKGIMMPGANGLTKAGVAVELKPGEEVSTVVNILALSGIDWPRGGSRVEIMFALGEKVEPISFYYMSKHHDALRDRALRTSSATPTSPADSSAASPGSGRRARRRAGSPR